MRRTFPSCSGLVPTSIRARQSATRVTPARPIGKRRRDRGAIPVIPHKANEKEKPAFCANALYKGRARIEQAVGKIKRFKRIALRCEKTKRNFASFVALAAGFILVKSVHTD